MAQCVVRDDVHDLLLLNVLPLGVFLGYARANSGSIWTCVFLHLLNNAAGLVLP